MMICEENSGTEISFWWRSTVLPSLPARSVGSEMVMLHNHLAFSSAINFFSCEQGTWMCVPSDLKSANYV